MSDHCPTCETLKAVIADTEAGAHEERLAKDAALRQAVSERKRADRLEAKLETQHAEAEDAKTIRACLAVWEKHCWGGRTKPCLDLTSDKADRVRKALEWERIDSDDVCDSFRGLGLLPYEGPYGKRSATKKPGFERKSGVEIALRDSSRLERFRDYYRRVQASPAERQRERWRDALAVAHQHLALLAQVDRLARFERQEPWPNASAIPAWMSDAMLRVLDRQIGSRVMDSEIKVLALMCCLTAEHAYYEHEFRDLHPDAPTITELAAPDDRPTLFVIDGGKEQAA